MTLILLEYPTVSVFICYEIVFTGFFPFFFVFFKVFSEKEKICAWKYYIFLLISSSPQFSCAFRRPLLLGFSRNTLCLPNWGYQFFSNWLPVDFVITNPSPLLEFQEIPLMEIQLFVIPPVKVLSKEHCLQCTITPRTTQFFWIDLKPPDSKRYAL